VNVIQLRQDHTSDNAIISLVEAAREKFAAEFSGSGQDFDSMIWNVKLKADRTTSNSRPRLYFTRYESLDAPLPAVFADVIKGWLILRPWSNIHSLGSKLDTARMLWEAILTRRKNVADDFRWDDLCEEDLNQAELMMLDKWFPSTAHKAATRLIALTEFLMARRICRPIYYTPQSPRIEDAHRHTIAGQEEKMAMLPSQRALEGLAEIYNQLATEPQDRLRACALAILVVTGFRIGELLTLPLNCEVEEERGDKQRYGLRYYKEKARGSERMFAVRWLTTTGAELARQAVAEIRQITLPFRERARILEEDPKRVPLPGFYWADQMTRAQVEEVMGLPDGSVNYIPHNKLPRHKDKREYYYIAAEVERYLLSLRAKKLWTIDRRDGSHQMLSESLLIAPRNFFSYRATLPLLIEPVSIQQTADFLSSRVSSPTGVIKSAFQRFDIREANGEYCQITSHQLRHWLNTIADKGGLPMEMLTHWMGRENPRDTDAYRHLTCGERLEQIRSSIRAGETSGQAAEFYNSLAPEDREEYLDGRVQAVHYTPFGVCLHDYSVSPCEFQMACIRGCPDFLRTKGDQKQQMLLIQLEGRTERIREASVKLLDGGNDLAKAWVDHCEKTLSGIRTARAVNDDPAIEDGSIVRPFGARGEEHAAK
jgi:integrase